MDPLTGIPSTKALVIGFGNTLRSDDGVGPHVAREVRSWGLPELQSLAVQQLTPELAEPLAMAELIIFVDARLDDGQGMIEVSRLGPSTSRGISGHAWDPRFLLDLARAIYGSQPQAWLITISAADFSLGEVLSLAVKRGAEAALAQICTLLHFHVSLDVAVNR